MVDMILDVQLSPDLEISWWPVENRREAKDLEAGLLTLYKQKFGHLPQCNVKEEITDATDFFEGIFQELLAHALE